MKRKVMFLLSFLLFSCSNGYKSEGTIKIENGEHKAVKVSYTIANFSDFSKRFTQTDFEYIVLVAATEAKSKCNYEATFVPLSFNIRNNLDTATLLMQFMAKNAFGVPGELTGYTKYQRTNLIESFVVAK
jgi:hypothetical protein